MTRLRSSLRIRMALLYGALVFLVGASLLVTSIVLIDRSIARSPIYDGSYGTLTITDQNGRVLFHGDPSVLGHTARSQARRYLVTTGSIDFLIIVVLGAAGGYLLAKQALRPIAQVTALAQRLSTETLDQRIHLGGPNDELKELSDTFDDMLGRLNAAFESQKLFVANASHELRTPLSVMRTELDVTLSDPDAQADELREMGEIVLQNTERAQRLVASLLVLARLQAGGVAELEIHEAVDLAELVPSVVSPVEPEAAERSISIRQYPLSAPTIGDPRLLERLIGNLVENGIRHNLTGGWLSIVTGAVGDVAYVEVSNGGPVIPAGDVDALFEPFRRGGRVRTATRGAGLGLSIVRLIVNAHHGTLKATAPPTGGLSVRIDLPRLIPPPAALSPAATEQQLPSRPAGTGGR